MKRMRRIIAYIVLVLMGCFSLTQVQASETSKTKVDTSITKVLDYKMKVSQATNLQELLDTFSEKPDSGVTETYCLALLGYQTGLDYTSYKAALKDFLGEKEQWETIGAASLQKHGLMLTALKEEHPLINYAYEETIGTDGIMSDIYGLFLVDGGKVPEAAVQRAPIVKRLVERQLADGGFSYTGEQGDVDVTAFALQALAPYKNLNEETKTAIEKALQFLSKKQTKAGDYGSLGVQTSESTAQVLIALCALNIDPLKDERFIKDSHSAVDGLFTYQLEDGSFSHTLQGQTNDMATAQCFTALVALHRMQRGQCFLYEYSNTAYDKDSMEMNSPASKEIRINYQWILTSSIVVLAILYICIRGRKNRYQVFGTIGIAALLILAVFTIHIQSASSYYENKDTSTVKQPIKVSISIDCSTVAGKEDFIPKNGVILGSQQVTVEEGSTVLELLLNVTAKNKIQMEYKDAGYIEGIQYLYERAYGNLSGWMYKVNGSFPSVGANEYTLKDSDVVEWVYTCNLGKDVGDTYNE